MTDDSFSQNSSPRWPLMLVLDASNAMRGSAIDELNNSLQCLLKSIQKDEGAAYSVDIQITRMGQQATQILPFTTAYQIKNLPHLEIDEQANQVALGEAINLALEKWHGYQEQCKNHGVSCYQPSMFIISDGQPSHDDWKTAAAKTLELSKQKKLIVLSIGIKNNQLKILDHFSDRPAKYLEVLELRGFFDWLSASISRVSLSCTDSPATTEAPTNT